MSTLSIEALEHARESARTAPPLSAATVDAVIRVLTGTARTVGDAA